MKKITREEAALVREIFPQTSVIKTVHHYYVEESTHILRLLNKNKEVDKRERK